MAFLFDMSSEDLRSEYLCSGELSSAETSIESFNFICEANRCLISPSFPYGPNWECPVSDSATLSPRRVAVEKAWASLEEENKIPDFAIQKHTERLHTDDAKFNKLSNDEAWLKGKSSRDAIRDIVRKYPPPIHIPLEEILNQLQKLRFNQRLLDTKLYTEFLGKIREAIKEGVMHGWNSGSENQNTVPTEAEMWALWIYGNEGFGNWSRHVLNYIEWSGLTWMTVNPEDRIIPLYWQKHCDKHGIPYKLALDHQASDIPRDPPTTAYPPAVRAARATRAPPNVNLAPPVDNAALLVGNPSPASNTAPTNNQTNGAKQLFGSPRMPCLPSTHSPRWNFSSPRDLFRPGFEELQIHNAKLRRDYEELRKNQTCKQHHQEPQSTKSRFGKQLQESLGTTFLETTSNEGRLQARNSNGRLGDPKKRKMASMTAYNQGGTQITQGTSINRSNDTFQSGNKILNMEGYETPQRSTTKRKRKSPSPLDALEDVVEVDMTRREGRPLASRDYMPEHSTRHNSTMGRSVPFHHTGQDEPMTRERPPMRYVEYIVYDSCDLSNMSSSSTYDRPAAGNTSPPTAYPLDFASSTTLPLDQHTVLHGQYIGDRQITGYTHMPTPSTSLYPNRGTQYLAPLIENRQPTGYTSRSDMNQPRPSIENRQSSGYATPMTASDSHYIDTTTPHAPTRTSPHRSNAHRFTRSPGMKNLVIDHIDVCHPQDLSDQSI